MNFQLKIKPEFVEEFGETITYEISIDWSKVEYFLCSPDGVQAFDSRDEAEVKQAELLFKKNITTPPTIIGAYS